jgi:two-component system, NtrC family, response regulator HydG
VLQDREITRLGSNEPIKVDVRFLAATNKDLEQAKRDKTFREDLYYRIRGAVIELPALRNRREDIPLLITHLVAKSAEKHGKKIEGMDSDAKAALVAHSWPGNVRELESTLDYMVALAQSPRLTLADVPAQVTGTPAPVDIPNAGVPVSDGTGAATTAITLAGMNLAELEKKAIQETLTAVQGNREQAAKILGIGERTLYRKINEYGLKE